jgi:hypothetical protein
MAPAARAPRAPWHTWRGTATVQAGAYTVLR